MDVNDKIEKLEEFKTLLRNWPSNRSIDLRTQINQKKAWIRREVIEAGCFHTVTIAPPPAIGGLIMQNIDPFDMIFDPPYFQSLIPNIIDMIDQTLGIIQCPEYEVISARQAIKLDLDTQAGYAFIAMPIEQGSHELADVLDAIKEAARRCGIHAERIDEVHSNERITDRILESIRKAEFVIVDLTHSKPNVFYEAGYAQGLQKIPIYIAKFGTKLEFDLKDYPVIFFQGIKELKDKLEERLRAVSKAQIA